MAVWQKVITSGSSAVLSQLTVGPAGGVAIQLLGNTAATTVLSGSFSGSHKGDGSGLTGISASATFPTSQLTPITDATQIFVNDGTNKYVTANQIYTASFGKVSGDITISNAGVATIAADSVALGADTSGNYVATITAQGGIVSTGATSGETIAHTLSISGSSTLSNNNVMKWSTVSIGGFVNSNITDTGTQVQIAAGASSGVTIAAGGIAVTGDSSFANNLTVTGNLAVAGTASFTNTDNLTIRDKFILINSGSTTLADSGWITQYNAAGSGSAFFLEAGTAGNAGPYGRFAVAYDVTGISTAPTVDEYVNTTKIGATTAIPSAAPTWGGSTNGIGNTYVTSDGQIYIYA
jgi:hypothetical protein